MYEFSAKLIEIAQTQNPNVDSDEMKLVLQDYTAENIAHAVTGASSASNWLNWKDYGILITPNAGESEQTRFNLHFPIRNTGLTLELVWNDSEHEGPMRSTCDVCLVKIRDLRGSVLFFCKEKDTGEVQLKLKGEYADVHDAGGHYELLAMLERLLAVNKQSIVLMNTVQCLKFAWVARYAETQS